MRAFPLLNNVSILSSVSGTEDGFENKRSCDVDPERHVRTNAGSECKEEGRHWAGMGPPAVFSAGPPNRYTHTE